MSCPETFTYSPRGRQGIGVIQPQSGLDYPLVAPSADIRYLLADFYFEYDDPGFYSGGIIAQHPLRIKWLYGVGCEENAAIPGMPTPTHAADILIVDADDAVIFDSTNLGPETGYQKFDVKDWGADYKIYEWIKQTAVCRIVVYKNWSPDEAAPVNYPVNLAPESAYIDERAVYRMPKRIKSLSVLNSTIRRLPVLFRDGYNVNLVTGAQEVVGLRYQTQITFDVTDTGEYSDCEEEKIKDVHTINGIPPNQNGQFFLTGDRCVFARVPTAETENGGVQRALIDGTTPIKIDSDCPPCCDCQDYVNMALYMNRTRNQYSRVGKRAHQTKLLHEQNINRWLDQRTCRLNKPLRISLSPLSCPYLEIILQFCNQCPTCLDDVVLSVTLSSSPAPEIVEVVPGYTIINGPKLPNEPFTVDGDWPTYNARIGFVDKGSSVYVKFVLKFSPRTVPYSVTGVLTGTVSGQPIKPCDPDYGNNEIAQSIETAALSCGPDGCTEVFVPDARITIYGKQKTVDGAGNVTYTILAKTNNAKPISYQWKASDDASNWFDLSDFGGYITGSNTNTLVLDNDYVAATPNRKYKVRMTADNVIPRTFEFSN